MTDDDRTSIALREMLHRQASSAVFGPVDTARGRAAPAPRWPRFAAAALVGAGLMAGGIAIGARVGNAPGQPVGVPGTPVSSVDSTPAPTEPSPSSTTNPAVDAAALASFLGLPDGWRVSEARSNYETSVGSSSTAQRWGDLGADGLSYARMVAVTVVPAIVGEDKPLSFRDGPGDYLEGEWTRAGQLFGFTAVGLSSDEVVQFIEALAPRDAVNAFAGFDGASLPLVEEQIGTGQGLPAEQWLTLALAGPDSERVEIDVFTRDGLAVSLGSPNRRVRVGDRIGVLGPGQLGTTISWAGNGVQYRVSSDAADAALRVGELMARQDDAAWRVLLEALPDTQWNVILEPSGSTVPGQ